jgi:hypothetical protein
MGTMLSQALICTSPSRERSGGGAKGTECAESTPTSLVTDLAAAESQPAYSETLAPTTASHWLVISSLAAFCWSMVGKTALA